MRTLALPPSLVLCLLRVKTAMNCTKTDLRVFEGNLGGVRHYREIKLLRMDRIDTKNNHKGLMVADGRPVPEI